MENFKKYIVLWLSQSISQLGSSMTAFSFVLWIYEQTHSALSISIISFCNYVPYILTSIFVGIFVDSHRKKSVMLVSDCVAAIASLFALGFLMAGNLSVWHIYIINIIVGVSTAFQQPASSVAIAKIVPKDKLSNVSGMNSFSSNLVIVFSPMLAAVIFSIGGLPLILLFDLFSFAIAFFVLLFLIRIPERLTKEKFKSPFAEILVGFHFLKTEKGILYIMLTMAVINFFSRLTYENILSPMILARSSENNLVLGIVNACMGIGGIVGGLLVSMKRESRKKSKYDLCFCCTIFSFRRFNNGCWQECIFLVICCSCCKFTTSIHYGGTKFDTVQKNTRQYSRADICCKKCCSIQYHSFRYSFRRLLI